MENPAEPIDLAKRRYKELVREIGK